MAVQPPEVAETNGGAYRFGGIGAIPHVILSAYRTCLLNECFIAVHAVGSGGSTPGPGARAPLNRGWAPNLAVLLTHRGQSIPGKLINLMPPDVRFFRLKCTKFDFRLQRSPHPLAVFKAAYF